MPQEPSKLKEFRINSGSQEPNFYYICSPAKKAGLVFWLKQAF